MVEVGSMHLRPQHRIRKAAEFQECREKGRKVFSKNLICVFHKNSFQHSRIGLIVTKKTGSATVRNRWKRIIRDFFRTHPNRFQQTMDYVFVVKATTKNLPPDDIRNELTTLVGRIKT
jgi:ribonuclease P protein component